MAQQTHFTFRVDGLADEALRVTAVEGREALGEPFAFRVEVVLPGAAELEDAPKLAGAKACLTFSREGGEPRHVHGELAWLARVGGAPGEARYQARLVPRLQRLALGRRSRVFQGKSVPEVVGEVLDAAGVEHRLELSGSYAARPLCVQYRESDLAFVSRLLEREGLFYFFEHAADGHTLVLCDGPRALAPIAGNPQVPWRPWAALTSKAEDEHVQRVSHTRRVRPGRVVLRDFDFLRPSAELSATAEAGGDGAPPLEHYDAPAGFTQPRDGQRLGRVRLEEVRVEALQLKGQSTCTRLVPGATFEVTEHADPDLMDPLLLLEVQHAARQSHGPEAAERDDHYENAFLAARADAPWRPARRTPVPVAHAETATVVGPKGEEAHVDAHGRIKVQLRWDRDGKGDDTSLCWVRLAQGWAGGGAGAVVVPRVGQEVVLRFLDGDPDQPLVVGALYNGEHAPPLALPDEKTRGTQRTASTPKADGSNELSFEDAAGEEQVYLHAQKDLRLDVENDAHEEALGAEAQRVARDRTLEVHDAQHVHVAEESLRRVDGRQAVRVGGGRTVLLGQSDELDVGGDRAVRVGGARFEGVTGEATVAVGGEASTRVAGASQLAVSDALTTGVGGARTLKVAGASSTHVGGTLDEQVAQARVLKVGQDQAVDVGGALDAQVAGDLEEKVDGKRELESVEPAQLMAGKFQLDADALKLVVGGKVALEVSRSGALKLAAGGTLSLDGSKLVLKGGKVKKQAKGSAPSASPKVTQLESRKDTRAALQLSLTDQHGKPVPNERFKVELPDGSVVFGRLDGGGKASVPATKEGSCKVTFPDLDGGAWKS